MRQSRFTVEEIIRILAESELPTASIAGTEARRLKVLEDENRRLKKLVAEKELTIQSLDEILKKKF